ncbi:Sucrase/ferredoxin-like-domain-containing protein [Mucidula mucida]|nr:Sucrase/ferredoxin-like-domain-containing protein [Mucidula mucida]
MTTRLPQAVRRLTTTAATERPSLLNTIPPHLCYIFLRSPQPISSLASRHTTPLQTALQRAVLHWGAFVNVAYYGDASSDEVSARAFYHTGLRLDIPSLSLDKGPDNVHKVVDRIADRRSPHTEHAQDTDVYIYVCTHGARDCRCGTTGVDTARALREEIAARGAAASRLKVAEVAHVGGHVYAANVLIYPYGDWLGYVTPKDAPTIVEKLLQATPPRIVSNTSEHTLSREPPFLPHHWRGRMGLPSTVQTELFNTSIRASSSSRQTGLSLSPCRSPRPL